MVVVVFLAENSFHIFFSELARNSEAKHSFKRNTHKNNLSPVAKSS